MPSVTPRVHVSGTEEPKKDDHAGCRPSTNGYHRIPPLKPYEPRHTRPFRAIYWCSEVMSLTSTMRVRNSASDAYQVSHGSTSLATVFQQRHCTSQRKSDAVRRETCGIEDFAGSHQSTSDMWAGAAWSGIATEVRGLHTFGRQYHAALAWRRHVQLCPSMSRSAQEGCWSGTITRDPEMWSGSGKVR
jgi:hypothetical protein